MNIYYHSLNEMDPRFGNKFATTYYKMYAAETAVATKNIDDAIEAILVKAYSDRDIEDWLFQPHDNFPRTGGKPNYSPWDIMEDMFKQLDKGKDITFGLEGRWNKIFAGSEYTLDMFEGLRHGKELAAFDKLFGEQI